MSCQAQAQSVRSAAKVCSADPQQIARRTTGNLRRSCEACRTLKVRCIIPTNSGSRACGRCITNATECVFEEALARPRRTKPTGRTRVKDVEEKLDGLIALISAGRKTDSASSHATPRPFPESRLQQSSPAMPYWQLSGIASASASAAGLFSMTSDWSVTSEAVLDPISRGVITAEVAEDVFRAFLGHSPLFGFIVLSPDMTLEYLCRERPCLLHAILAAGSVDGLQKRLAADFRRMIAERAIVRAEKNLDILQGLLTYLCWHHLYIDPAHQNIYQLSQLALSMAVELELGDISESTKQELICAGTDHRSRMYDMNYAYQVECLRTYIACHHASSYVSIAMRRPVLFRFNKQAEDCSHLLSILTNEPSDLLLPYFVRLQRLSEDVYKIFHYGDCEAWTAETMDEVRIYAMVQTFLNELNQLKAAMPPEEQMPPNLKTKCLHLDIYIHEVGLHVPRGHASFCTTATTCPSTTSSSNSPMTTPSTDSSSGEGGGSIKCCSWCSSPLRADIVVSAIRAAQRYIEAYLRLSDAQLRASTLMEEAKALYAILVLGAVTLEQNTQQLGAARLRDLADMGSYLGALERRFAGLVTSIAPGDATAARSSSSSSPPGEAAQERHDYFWQMRQFAANSLAWHGRFVGGLDGGAASERVDKCNGIDLSIMRVLGTSPFLMRDSDPQLPPPQQVMGDAMISDPLLDASWMIDQGGLWPDLEMGA
ncbi:hypothetical protein NKR23_g4613 [Pleurostoma richardsiae]|uniref:Zn(2)-C6 fungal-type domain-containing protein n=1 Tax=Pleurostoma richardsiae TaxID=41990 RepID=A0AA38RFS3_9PEZI|nr:hypothetical protein NKR23_g4613 [Pleurostoma richardsiae]